MCAGCGAPMKLDAGKDFLACEYCGAAHFPGRNPDGPKCAKEMDTHPYGDPGNVIIDTCEKVQRIVRAR